MNTDKLTKKQQAACVYAIVFNKLVKISDLLNTRCGRKIIIDEPFDLGHLLEDRNFLKLVRYKTIAEMQEMTAKLHETFKDRLDQYYTEIATHSLEGIALKEKLETAQANVYYERTEEVGCLYADLSKAVQDVLGESWGIRAGNKSNAEIGIINPKSSDLTSNILQFKFARSFDLYYDRVFERINPETNASEYSDMQLQVNYGTDGTFNIECDPKDNDNKIEFVIGLGKFMTAKDLHTKLKAYFNTVGELTHKTSDKIADLTKHYNKDLEVIKAKIIETDSVKFDEEL